MRWWESDTCTKNIADLYCSSVISPSPKILYFNATYHRLSECIFMVVEMTEFHIFYNSNSEFCRRRPRFLSLLIMSIAMTLSLGYVMYILVSMLFLVLVFDKKCLYVYETTSSWPHQSRPGTNQTQWLSAHDYHFNCKYI